MGSAGEKSEGGVAFEKDLPGEGAVANLLEGRLLPLESGVPLPCRFSQPQEAASFVAVAHEVGLDIEDKLLCEGAAALQCRVGIGCLGRANSKQRSVDGIDRQESCRQSATGAKEFPAIHPQPRCEEIREFQQPLLQQTLPFIRKPGRKFTVCHPSHRNRKSIPPVSSNHFRQLEPFIHGICSPLECMSDLVTKFTIAAGFCSGGSWRGKPLRHRRAPARCMV